MKTFSDLTFFPHPTGFPGAKQAIQHFENGYGVSVVFGKHFYSNGVDTYEVAVLLNNSLCYDSGLTEDVFGHLSIDEVSDVMMKVQQLATKQP